LATVQDPDDCHRRLADMEEDGHPTLEPHDP
jgi:hypothetical protein